MKAKTVSLFIILLFHLVLNAQDNKWFQKGIEAKDPDEKVKLYTKSLRKEGKSFATYNNRGLARYQIQDFKGALSDFDNSISLIPKSPFGYLLRGDTKKCLMDYDGAISDYKKFFELTPYLFNTIQPTFTQGSKMDTVRSTIRFSGFIQLPASLQSDSLNIDHVPVSISYSGSDPVPQFLSLLDNMGYCYLAKEDYSSALKFFNKCMAFKSDYIDAILGMVLTYYYQNDSVNTKKFLDRATGLNPILKQGGDWFQPCKKGNYSFSEKEYVTLKKIILQLK